MNADHQLADALDADYLICQRKTNSVIVMYRAKLQLALNNLHRHLTEVSEEEVCPAPRVNVAVPRIDYTSSRPRARTPTVAEQEELTKRLAKLRAAR